MRKIKKNDMVRIIAGREKGKTGKVLSVLDGGQRIKVEKCNMVKRHSKASAQYQAGGIIDKEAPLHISNVALTTSDGEPTRVNFRFTDSGDGASTKARYSRKYDRVLD